MEGIAVAIKKMHCVNGPSNDNKVTTFELISIYLRTINHKKFSNVPLGSLVCPLQITNDIELMSLIIYKCCKHILYPPITNNKIYSSGYSSDSILKKIAP